MTETNITRIHNLFKNKGLSRKTPCNLDHAPHCHQEFTQKCSIHESHIDCICFSGWCGKDCSRREIWEDCYVNSYVVFGMVLAVVMLVFVIGNHFRKKRLKREGRNGNLV